VQGVKGDGEVRAGEEGAQQVKVEHLLQQRQVVLHRVHHLHLGKFQPG
jgi:hypothetical protein